MDKYSCFLTHHFLVSAGHAHAIFTKLSFDLHSHLILRAWGQGYDMTCRILAPPTTVSSFLYLVCGLMEVKDRNVYKLFPKPDTQQTHTTKILLPTNLVINMKSSKYRDQALMVHPYYILVLIVSYIYLT